MLDNGATTVVSYFRSRAGSYVLLVILSVIWGLAFVAIRYLDFQLDFVDLTLLRWIVASAGYLALLPFIGRAKTRLERRDLPRLLLIAFFNVAAYHLALNYAEKTVSSGLAGLLISLGPVFTALLSVSFLKEKVGAKLGLALILAVLGATILSLPDLAQGSTSLSGPFAVALSAFSVAAFSVLSKPLVAKYGAFPIAVWAGMLGTCMLLPLFSSTFVRDVVALPLVGWASLLYLSLLSTVLGYSLFYVMVGRGGVTKLMIQLYLAPVISVIGGAVLLQESVTPFTLLGGAAMLIAVWLATGMSKA